MFRRLRNRGRRDPTDQQGASLVSEAEAFLNGALRQSAGVSGPRSANAWVELNWIAHAPPNELRLASAAVRLRASAWGTWEWAVGTLLDELAAQAGEGPSEFTTVKQLQRRCMIPLELAVMEAAPQPVAPAEVVAVGITWLRAFSNVHESDGD